MKKGSLEPCDHFAVELRETVGDGLPGKSFFHSGASVGDPFGLGRTTPEADDAIGQALGFPRFDKNAVDVVFDNIHDTAGAG